MEAFTKKRPSVVISFTGKTLYEETQERRNRYLGIQPEEPQKPLEEKKEKVSWWKKLFG
ncbi:MAG: hypothetical protein JRI57_00675 [Deltaproteobacteria bacterium]|nr:hypothetical protein [Deltaproteobacteria bacterium]MBW1952845.1 hypothetical protein [Deltaproteobacteria bacterium]MBW2133604.1 hypothetical protein [Deltaproteobacteria bacterium]